MAYKIQDLRDMENKVYKYSRLLGSALAALGEAASNVLGYEVVADLCNGHEIEFRRLEKDGLPDSYDTIRMEDIEKFL